MDAIVNVFGATTLLLLILAAIGAGAMTASYLRGRHDSVSLELEPSEQFRAQFDEDWGIRVTRSAVTGRRILQAQRRWWLSRRHHRAIALRDVHSVYWYRGMHRGMLAAAVVSFWFYSPLAVVFTIAAIELSICAVVFRVSHAHAPFGILTVATPLRARGGELWSFYAAAHLAWAQSRIKGDITSGSPGLQPWRPADDFAFGRPALTALLVAMPLAVALRMFDEALLDTWGFGGIFLGLPIAAGICGRRDGVWASVFVTLALWSVRHPAPGMWQAITGAPGLFSAAEFATIFSGMVVTAMLAGRTKTPLSATLALLVWPAGIWLWRPDALGPEMLSALVVAAGTVLVTGSLLQSRPQSLSMPHVRVA